MAVTISGLKYTTGLAMAGLDDIGPPSLTRLFSLLARQRINLSFLISSHTAENDNSAWCGFDNACFPTALAVISGHMERDSRRLCGACMANVAALTLYPRGKGLGLAMGVPAALIAAGLIPLAPSSSLGATVVLVKNGHLQRALETLLSAFPLPCRA